MESILRLSPSSAMKITTPQGKEYLNYWLCALQRLLAWDRADVLTWAQRFEGELNDDRSLLYRELPMHPISFALIPSRVHSMLEGFERLSLASRLEDAIRVYDLSDEGLAAYDWDAAIARIDAILSEYGESLASVRGQPKE